MAKIKITSASKNIFSLKNKNIVIFGGSGKIGISFSKILSSFGAKVFLLDLRRSKNKIKKGVTFIKCDVSDEKEIQNKLNLIIKKYKKIDTMIYNIYSKPKNYYQNFENYKLETWKKVLQTNLTGAFLVSQFLTKYFKKRKIKGNLIFLLSTYGIVGPNYKIYEGLKHQKNIYGGNFSLNTPASYTTTKSALLGLMKYLATNFGKYGIRSNTLTPGGVYDGQEKKFVKKYINQVPLNRMAKFNDYDGAILYLASDASSYMTGANLVVDGGWTAW